MTSNELKNTRAKMMLTQQTLADRLGLSIRTIQTLADRLGLSIRTIKYYEAGEINIPRPVELAIRAIELEAASWQK